MSVFATEFPIKQLPSKAALVAQILAWLRGTKYSNVLEAGNSADLAGETAYLSSPGGEELRLREISANGDLDAVGFRHDFPDNEGRLWRTEAVVRRRSGDGGQDLIRFRTQSVARRLGARLDVPRKPYLVKALLADGWGGNDGLLGVTDRPLWLEDGDAALTTAQEITLGRATQHLPVVYVSAARKSEWQLNRDEIQKLAYDLGGVAHVVVEPDRAFSFRLRDKVNGANAYGGTLGVALPGRGIVRRFFLGWQLPSGSDLLVAAKTAALEIRSQMPAHGWDWTELQERALRGQRERERNRLTAQEAEQLFQLEIDTLQDEIKQLKGQIAEYAEREQSGKEYEGVLPEPLVEQIGPEIYPGEFSDRLRLGALLAYKMAEQTGLDRRSIAVLEAIIANLPLSSALAELEEDLKRATKDPKRVASELTTLLCRHGYMEKSDNKHIRLEAQEGYAGLDSITLPKTPSEGRGLINLRKQIEGTLGIAALE